MKTRTNQPVEGDEIENLEVSGELKAFENIVDKDGHARFIEGDFDVLPEATGVSKIYAKWSLSGSHLMIVLCFSLEDATSFSTTYMAKVELPQWIKDKMVPVFTNNIIPYVGIIIANEAYNSTQNANIALRKNDNDIILVMASITTTAKRYGRIQFDLLIDDE